MAAPMKRHVCMDQDEIPAKRTTTDDDEERLQCFLNWSNNADFKLSPKVCISKQKSCAQYGMVAIEPINEGELLFQIPRSHILTPATSGVAQLLQKDSSSLAGASGWVSLLVALMYEYNNPKSLWRPYFDLVPDFKELDLPMFWPRSELERLLPGTGVLESVDKDLQNIEREFNTIVVPFVKKHSDTFSVACRDLELYKRMVAFVMAYSFTEKKDDDDEEEEEDGDKDESPPMMVPMADILNHVAKNNANLRFERESLKMVATQKIEKDEEVFNTYGELANSHLLHMYGFAEPYPDNHYDTVEIPASQVFKAATVLEHNSEELLKAKEKYLEVLGLAGEGASFVFGPDGVLTEEEMAETLKVLCKTKDVFDTYIEDDGWEEEEDEQETSLSYDSFAQVPSEWKQILSRTAESRLKDYPSSVEEEEEERVKSETLTSRDRYAVYTAIGQQKLLTKLQKICSLGHPVTICDASCKNGCSDIC